MGACGPPGASRCSARTSLPTPRGEPRFGVDCTPSRPHPRLMGLRPPFACPLPKRLAIAGIRLLGAVGDVGGQGVESVTFSSRRQSLKRGARVGDECVGFLEGGGDCTAFLDQSYLLVYVL